MRLRHRLLVGAFGFRVKVMVRILSYNIHKGVCYYSRKVVLEELRRAIRAVNADIVFLQEVCGESPRHSLGPQFEFLADELWPHFAYGKNAIYQKGHHGNAILSKFPIEFQHNLDISTNRLERRGLLHAKVTLPKFGTLHVFCIHCDLLEKGRSQQMDMVVARVQEVVPDGEAVMMAGDFNDWRMRISQRLKKDLAFEEAGMTFLGHHAKTFPSVRPTFCLDRIYFRGMELSDYSVLKEGDWQNLSDHLAVTAKFSERKLV
jgi:endonuclease/exonuclease/phosphatase family metal-dependent hydrolase